MEDSHDIQSFLNIINESLSEWKDVKLEEVEFHLLPSMTNTVYKVVCRNSDIRPNPIIFRKFFQGHGIIDRPKERKLFLEVARVGYGPKCYFENEKYRIEQWIESNPMKGHEYNENPENRRRLARAVAKFHRIQVPWIKPARYLPNDIDNESFLKPFLEKYSKRELFTDKEYAAMEEMKKVISPEEKEFIKKIFPKEEDLVLSHNDISLGNALRYPDGSNIVLIDYEYAGKNFRGFDIGYLFHQGRLVRIPDPPCFRFNDDNFPSDDDLREFIEYYIVFSDISEEQEKLVGEQIINDYSSFKEYLKNNYEEDKFSSRVEDLLFQTKLGVLACNFYIVTWAITMSKVKPGKFDHIEFAKCGYEYYCRYRKELSDMH